MFAQMNYNNQQMIVASFSFEVMPDPDARNFFYFTVFIIRVFGQPNSIIFVSVT